MTRKYSLELVPSLIVGVAILVSALVMVRAGHSRWMELAGPLLLASLVVVADVVRARLRGNYTGPTAGGLVTAGAIAVAGLVLIGMNVNTAGTFVPLYWVAAMSHVNGKRRACGTF
jgi:hypothetical protein